MAWLNPKRWPWQGHPILLSLASQDKPMLSAHQSVVCVYKRTCIHIKRYVYASTIYTYVHIYLSICLSIHLSIYVSICLSTYLSIYVHTDIVYVCIYTHTHADLPVCQGLTFEPDILS